MTKFDNRSGMYLIEKRGLYYRPFSKGYTGIKAEAGQYTKKEADSIEDIEDGVFKIAFEDAPEFALNCCVEIKANFLLSERDALRAKIAELEAQKPKVKRYAWRKAKYNGALEVLVTPIGSYEIFESDEGYFKLRFNDISISSRVGELIVETKGIEAVKDSAHKHFEKLILSALEK